MQDFIRFAITHTPFWAIPVIIICGEFGYIFWLKAFRLVAIVNFSIAFFALLVIAFYVWSGGPDAAARTFVEWVNML